MFQAIAFFRLRRSTKRQKTLFRTFVSRRNGKKLFSGPSSVDETAKNSFSDLRQSTKRQKTLFCAFVSRQNGKKLFFAPSLVDEAAKNIFPSLRRSTKRAGAGGDREFLPDNKKEGLATAPEKDPETVGQAFLSTLPRRSGGRGHYQIFTRSSGAINIGSPSLISNAL